MTMIMVNLMIAVILEAFNDSESSDLVEIINTSIRLWPRYDRDLELRATVQDTFKFVIAVAKAFEVDFEGDPGSMKAKESDVAERELSTWRKNKSFMAKLRGQDQEQFSMSEVPMQIARVCEVKLHPDGRVHFLHAVRMAVAVTLSGSVAESKYQASLRDRDGRKVMVSGQGLILTVEAVDICGSKFPIIKDGAYFRLEGLPNGEDMKFYSKKIQRDNYLMTSDDKYVILNEGTGCLEPSNLSEGALLVDKSGNVLEEFEDAEKKDPKLLALRYGQEQRSLPNEMGEQAVLRVTEGLDAKKVVIMKENGDLFFQDTSEAKHATGSKFALLKKDNYPAPGGYLILDGMVGKELKFVIKEKRPGLKLKKYLRTTDGKYVRLDEDTHQLTLSMDKDLQGGELEVEIHEQAVALEQQVGAAKIQALYREKKEKEKNPCKIRKLGSMGAMAVNQNRAERNASSESLEAAPIASAEADTTPVTRFEDVPSEGQEQDDKNPRKPDKAG
jgi:hypothetical protein